MEQKTEQEYLEMLMAEFKDDWFLPSIKEMLRAGHTAKEIWESLI